MVIAPFFTSFLLILTSGVEWKWTKIHHFRDENLRLINLLPPATTAQPPPENPFYGYAQSPSYWFPVDKLDRVRWVYLLDLDKDTLSVGIPFCSERLFYLKNIPRSLFNPDPFTGGAPTGGQYAVLIDVIPRIHLASISGETDEPDPELVALYHNYSPQIQPLHPVLSSDTFPVRKYLRLCLMKIFCNSHSNSFTKIYSGRIRAKTDDTPHDRFRQIIYGLVKLASSSVEVKFQYDDRYRSTLKWEYFRHLEHKTPPLWSPPIGEYRIGDILVVPELHLSTEENLQAAVGRALQLMASSDDSPSTGRALIISLDSLVVLDIRNNEVSHTRNIPLITRPDEETDGLLALLNILYTPSPLPAPQSFPNLPVEICQKIFGYASNPTKRALELSGRLFRGISYDYGPRIGEWSLKARASIRECQEGGFIGAADVGMHIIDGIFQDVPARGAVLHISKEMQDVRPVHRAVLRGPGEENLALQMPLLGAYVTRSWNAT